MPAGFTGSLAARLDRMSPLHVREAAARRPARARHRPRRPRRHATCASTATRQARLTDEAPIGGLRPRADLTIADVAAGCGERTAARRPDRHGPRRRPGRPRRARRRRARPLEAAETCTVYGMPRAVVEDGLADVVLPLGELAEAIAAEAGA